MNRPVRAGEVFTTFIFDGYDCADMGVYSVTNGGTYTMNIEPVFKDELLEVPAYDGRYYFGTQLTHQIFQFNLFADNLSLTEYRNLRNWLMPRKIGRLIIPDQPYKYYLVKVTSIGELGNYPNTDANPIVYSKLGDQREGNVIYVGNFTVTFETVGSVYGQGLCYYRDDLIYDALNHYGLGIYPENYYYDSGLLYKDMSPALKTVIKEKDKKYAATWYNPGTAAALPELEIKHEGIIPTGGYLQIDNNTLNSSTIIDLGGIEGNVIIDTESELIKDSKGVTYFGRFSGNPLEIGGEKDVLHIPESYTENIEDTYFTDYDSIYVEYNNVPTTEGMQRKLCAKINPLVCKVNKDMIGKYFCINLNGGARIDDIWEEENFLILSEERKTYEIPSPTGSRPAGFKCTYIGKKINDDTKPVGKTGDVYCKETTYIDSKGEEKVLKQEMFLYRYDKWEKTNYFTSDSEFEKEPIHYLVFGANIVGLDDIEIHNNFGQCEVNASILPRYL